MRDFTNPLVISGASLRGLLLGAVAAGALAGCAQVFGIEALSEGNAADAGGGAPPDAAVAPPDAAPAYAPFACDWKPGSVRLVNSLIDRAPPENEYGGKIVMAPGNRNVRVFLEHTTPNGRFIEVWSISADAGRLLGSFVGNQAFVARRLGVSQVGALVSRESATGDGRAQLILATMPDSDDFSAFQVLEVSPLLPMVELEADFTPIGVGAASDLVVVASYRPAPNLPYRADFLYWSAELGTAANPITFDEDLEARFGNADYDVAELLRDGMDRNHVFLGSRFDGALGTRHFILGDAVGGITAPVRMIDDLLIGLERRPDGSFLAGYAELDQISGTLALRIGQLTGNELATHTASDLPGIVPIGTMNDIPTEGEPFFTQDHFIVTGKRMRNGVEEIAVIIAHRAGQLRTNQGIPMPPGVAFPDGSRFRSIGAMVADPLFFDSVGGDIAMVWTMTVGDPGGATAYDELYYGELQCVPPSAGSP